MNTRKLVSTSDSRVRLFQVFNDAGQQIGTDEEPIPTLEQANAATIRGRLLQALAANSAFLALNPPTPLQTAQHQRQVTQELSALIRLILEQLDTTNGT